MDREPAGLLDHHVGDPASRGDLIERGLVGVDAHKRFLSAAALPQHHPGRFPAERHLLDDPPDEQSFALEMTRKGTGMRTKFAAIAIAAIAVAGAPPAAVGSDSALAERAPDKDCSDFDTREEAQKFFKKHGGSKKNDPFNLDSDHDGKACETLPKKK